MFSYGFNVTVFVLMSRFGYLCTWHQKFIISYMMSSIWINYQKIYFGNKNNYFANTPISDIFFNCLALIGIYHQINLLFVLDSSINSIWFFECLCGWVVGLFIAEGNGDIYPIITLDYPLFYRLFLCLDHFSWLWYLLHFFLYGWQGGSLEFNFNFFARTIIIYFLCLAVTS